MSSPLGLALATPAGKRTLYLLGLCGAVRGFALILIAQAVAGGIVAVMEGRPLAGWVVTGLVGGALRALEAWAGQAVAGAGASGVKVHWRARLSARALLGGGRDLDLPAGALTMLATRGLDEIDEYFLSALPALTASLTVPVVLLARIALVDWVSTLVLVVTLPLVPLFMALIGRYTLERVERAQEALDRLGTSLVELVRGLPVLIGLGRARAQTESLRRIAQEYRESTMSTLRVAFLSALALELIATLSVALIAVFIGVRLVSGTLGLEAGLLVLILAPELFLPLRQLGAAFHASENGRAAEARAAALAARPQADDPRRPGDEVRVADLAVRYPGRAADAVSGVSLTARPGRIHLLDGPSGAGKSTVLAVLAGLQREGVRGAVSGIDPAAVASLAQAPQALDATAGADVATFVDHPDPAVIDDALARAGLAGGAAMDPRLMSPGELRRLGLARVFARVAQGARLVLLDEPTAHLDADTASGIVREIRRLGPEVAVVIATHDPALRSSAHDRTVLGATAAPEASELPSLAGAPPVGQPVREHDLRTTRPSLAVQVRRWRTAVRPTSRSFVLAVAFGVASTLAATALTAVSGWLIVRASFQPPIMLLLVAIVGVRFFGLARSVLRYAERLWMHDAILGSIGDLRARLWDAFARRGTADRAVLRPDAALRAMVSELDDIRDLTPRVVLPPIVAVLVMIAAVVTGALIHPAAALVLAGLGILGLGLGSSAALLADRRAFAESLAQRAGVLSRLSQLLGAREDLAANGRSEAAADELRLRDAAAEGRAAASARAAGLAQAVVVGCGVAATVAMLLLLAAPVAAGDVSAELLAVATLLPLALIDPLADAVQAVRRAPALGRLLARREDFDTPAEAAARPGVGERPDEVGRLACRSLAARWPGTADPVFTGLGLDASRGDWVRVTGPSGSGKTTLVSVLLRFLDPDAGRYEVNDTDATRWGPEALEGRLAWCPQEAHIFDSSLRANLLLARAPEDAPDDEEMWRVLARVGLDEVVREWPEGLGERLGASGARLSGGQRQRVAVARTLLTRAQALVLDEPTAHLDAPMAEALLGDLRRELSGGIVVEVTHHGNSRPGDQEVELTGRAPVSPSSPRT